MNRSALVGRWTLVILTAFVVQVGVVPQFPVFGVVGDLMVAVSLAAGLVGGAERGAIVGFWCGFLFDLVRPGALGVSSLAYCVCGFAVGLLAVSVLQFGRPVAIALMGAGSAVATLLFASIAQVFGEHTLTNPSLWKIVGVVSLLNAIAAPLVVWACRLAEGDHQPADAGPVQGVGGV